MSWRVSLKCTRAEAEALPDGDDLFQFSDSPPVIVADEPDPHAPDEWRIHAYFKEQPTTHELVLLGRLARDSQPEIEHLGEDDWVVMSQSGLEPIRAGRFFVHTPTHQTTAEAGEIAFEIDAGLAFGTGQHDTTAGCLAALDRLESAGKSFSNMADIGTGTGLLAFAALALWPDARAIATDIDPIAVDVSAENARINRVSIGHGPGQLLLAVADGMDHEILVARAPFDLIIANILAGPLIALAPAFGQAAAPGAVAILAGLLDSQAEAVIAAFEGQGFVLSEQTVGEWPVLVMDYRGRAKRPGGTGAWRARSLRSKNQVSREFNHGR